MADLVIDARAVGGDPGRRLSVVIRLTDLNGNNVTGYTSDETVVEWFTGRTNTAGELTVDLEPNASITPANTYYTVAVNGRSMLIEKGAGSENLVDCLVTSPSALGLAATSRTFTETSDPAAPIADKAILYARDNGGGKTQLCVRFPTGAVQVIATEP
jgi:hypothetical protein